MDISYDYRDLFKTLNKYKVQYLVVGAYAVGYYAEPRFTKDLDIWVNPDNKNVPRVYKALKEFGAPLKGVEIQDFSNKKMFYQIGVAPVRIDIITGLGPLKFDVAWKNRRKTKYAGISINIIGLKDLIKSKKIYRRKQDILDIEKLESLLKKKKI